MWEFANNDMMSVPGSNRAGAETPPRLDPLDLFLDSDYMQRPPEWRWMLVRQHAVEETKPGRADKPIVHQAYRYYMQFKKLSELEDKTKPGKDMASIRRQYRELVRRYPEIAMAHHINKSCSDIRWLLEAEVCAKVTPEVIAADIYVKPEVVDTYEQLFFDVRGRLDAVGYMDEYVLKPHLRRGGYAVAADLLWKEIAFTHGRDMLHQLRSTRILPQASVEKLKQMSESNTYRDHYLQQVLRPITARTSEQIGEEFAAMQMHTAATTTANQLNGQVAQGVDILVSAMMYSKASLRAGSIATALEERPAACLRRMGERGFLSAAKALPETPVPVQE